jgi:hypothetical protein
MALKNWRSIAVRVLAAEMGPTADNVISETLKEMNTLEGEMVASRFLLFLKKIYHLLPDDVDKSALLYKLRNEVLSQYGFKFD